MITLPLPFAGLFVVSAFPAANFPAPLHAAQPRLAAAAFEPADAADAATAPHALAVAPADDASALVDAGAQHVPVALLPCELIRSFVSIKHGYRHRRLCVLDANRM